MLTVYGPASTRAGRTPHTAVSPVSGEDSNMADPSTVPAPYIEINRTVFPVAATTGTGTELAPPDFFRNGLCRRARRLHDGRSCCYCRRRARKPHDPYQKLHRQP